MIKINKPNNGPDVRYTTGPFKGVLTWRAAEAKVLKAYKNNPNQFNDGTYKFPALYRYIEYRDAIEQCQGPKCCFCEKPVSGGQIEHFRPKAGWSQMKGDSLTRPGYFWIAYRWDNFLISCGECNQQGRKGNLFPISGVRSLTPKHDLDAEDCQIINPAKEDPSRYISFNEDVPISIDKHGRGDLNISLFELISRGDIKTIRRDKFDLYRTCNLIAKLSNHSGLVSSSDISNAKLVLNRAKNRKESFAGMIRENLKKGLL